MITAKELLSKLPGSWSELTLKQYQLITDVSITETDEFDNKFVGTDNTIKVISKLSDVPVNELESLPVHVIAVCAGKLAFIATPPQPLKKSTIEWKTLEEISYDTYVTYVSLSKEPIRNMHLIIKGFCKNKLTDEQVLNLGTDDAMTGFFLLNRYVKQYLKRTIRQTRIQLMKQLVKQKMKTLPFRVKTKK
jgi:hypothetical protein